MVWVGIGIYTIIYTVQKILAKKHLSRFIKPATVILMLLAGTLIPAAVLSNHINPEYTNFQVHYPHITPYSRNFLGVPDRIGVIITVCKEYSVWFA